MNPITYQEAVAVLRHAGFSSLQIERLYRLRHTARSNPWDQPPLDLKRLRFVRWLVDTSHLTDWPDGPQEARSALPTEKWPRVSAKEEAHGTRCSINPSHQWNCNVYNFERRGAGEEGPH